MAEKSVLTPWEVSGEVDYDKLVKEFGTSLISDKIRRYSCIEELVEDFDEKTQPSFMDGIRASWKSWLVKLSIIGVSGVLFYNTIQDIKSNMREASKYRVVTDWDGDKLEIVNNLVDFIARLAISELFILASVKFN